MTVVQLIDAVGVAQKTLDDAQRTLSSTLQAKGSKYRLNPDDSADIFRYSAEPPGYSVEHLSSASDEI